MTSLEKALRDFAQFAAKLKGDEKSEAQTFLFHLLAAFGHDANTLPEGSTFEYRVRFPGRAHQVRRFRLAGPLPDRDEIPRRQAFQALPADVRLLVQLIPPTNFPVSA